MTKPFGLTADVHLHPWSAFSTVLPSGLNSRYAGQLGELSRLAQSTAAAGGKYVVIAGDLFHVRGSVSPTILNALRDELSTLSYELGIKWVILSGNHDLEGRNSERLGSAVTALEGDNVQVINETTYLPEIQATLIPWIENIDKLKEEITNAPKCANLILHAPVDGVIPGLPSHGLTSEWLAAQGFGRVWSGHYHNHKEMESGKVISIGALSHLTWSDVGSRAGFHVVHESGSNWFASHLPSFLDLDEIIGVTVNHEELPMVVDGNYVRIKVEASKVKDVEDARQELLKMGAAGVLVRALPKPEAHMVRASSSVKAGSSLESSVTDYAKTITTVDPDLVAKEALDILNTIKSE